MVAMRDRLVPAAGRVPVGALDFRRAVGRIGRVDTDDMLVDMIVMHVVQMAVMQIVDMPVVANRDVTAVWAMLMGMVRMVLLGTSRHGISPSLDSTEIGLHCLSAACSMALCIKCRT